MESIIRDVSALDDAQRHALEHVIGRESQVNQRLLIQIVSLDVPPTTPTDTPPTKGNQLPDWCNVYEGLSDDEIAELEKVVLTRADLTRSSE